MFKRKRGIYLPYNRQGLIYFTCMNIKSQPKETQEKIKSLCTYVAGDDSPALLELLTNDRKSVLSISLERYIPEKRLYAYRKEFYELWDKFQSAKKE